MIDVGNIPIAVAPKAASVAASGTLVSGWFDSALYCAVHALVGIGSGAGTPTLTFEQATAAAGTGAKALDAWSGGTFDTDRIEVTNQVAGLDVAGKFRWVRATVTIAGGAGTVTSLTLLGLEPHQAD